MNAMRYHVAGPTRPSSVRLNCRWNARTARSVSALNTPSVGYIFGMFGKLVEMRLRRVWTVRTSSEKSPSRSVTPGNDPPRLGESGAPVTKLRSLPYNDCKICSAASPCSASGPGVQLLQYFLAIVGEFYDALPRWQAGQLDGVFGPQTREAVTAYQQLVGLPITGAVDRETWYALLSTYQSVLLSQPEQEWLGQFVGLPETFLVKGMRGKAVRQAQQLINIIARGYAEVPAVAEDGIFGDATESSVASIQSLLGLPATGAIGPLTWEGMADLAENVLAGSQNAAGQYPGYPVGEEAT